MNKIINKVFKQSLVLLIVLEDHLIKTEKEYKSLKKQEI